MATYRRVCMLRPRRTTLILDTVAMNARFHILRELGRCRLRKGCRSRPQFTRDTCTSRASHATVRSSAAAPPQPCTAVGGWERAVPLPARPASHAFAVRGHTSASAGRASAWEGLSRPASLAFAFRSHPSASAGHASATASHASASGHGRSKALTVPVSSPNAHGAATEAASLPSKLLPRPCCPDGADAPSRQRCSPAVRIRKVRPAAPLHTMSASQSPHGNASWRECTSSSIAGVASAAPSRHAHGGAWRRSGAGACAGGVCKVS